jgi:CO dehydrogenase maturation factor
LGLDVERTIGDIREETRDAKTSFPGGMTKGQYIEYRIRECLVEKGGLDFIAMGRPEGPTCYCYVNHLLRGYLDALKKPYRHVVVDNEAGMEHLSRRTTFKADLMLVVTDTSLAGVRAAGRIARLADELGLGVGRKALVVNRCGAGDLDPIRGEIEKTGIPLAGSIPPDPAIPDFERNGRPIIDLPEDSPAVVAADAVFASLLGLVS